MVAMTGGVTGVRIDGHTEEVTVAFLNGEVTMTFAAARSLVILAKRGSLDTEQIETG